MALIEQPWPFDQNNPGDGYYVWLTGMRFRKGSKIYTILGQGWKFNEAGEFADTIKVGWEGNVYEYFMPEFWANVKNNELFSV